MKKTIQTVDLQSEQPRRLSEQLVWNRNGEEDYWNSWSGIGTVNKTIGTFGLESEGLRRRVSEPLVWNRNFLKSSGTVGLQSEL